MPKKILLISLLLILLLIGIAWEFAQGKLSFLSEHTSSAGIVFFSSSSCADCQETERWFQAQNLTTKITFDQKEVNTPDTQAELQQAANDCKLSSTKGIELPFLFAAGKCYMGSADIESFFKQKLGLTQPTLSISPAMLLLRSSK